MGVDAEQLVENTGSFWGLAGALCADAFDLTDFTVLYVIPLCHCCLLRGYPPHPFTNARRVPHRNHAKTLV